MKKWLIIATIVFGVIFAVAAGTALWGAHAAKNLLKKGRHDIAGLTLDIGGSDISWISARLILKNIKIYPAEKVDERFRILEEAFDPAESLRTQPQRNEKTTYLSQGNR